MSKKAVTGAKVEDTASKPTVTVKTRRRVAVSPPDTSTDAPPAPQQARQYDIEVAAYYLAEKRGFAPDQELDDWLIAERQVLLARDTDT